MNSLATNAPRPDALRHVSKGEHMSDQPSQDLGDLNVDTENLYHEETFTDLRAASIRRHTPVKADGSPDPGRSTTYIGETTLMTQMGPIPVHFSIEAKSLSEAFGKFPDGVKSAIERLNDRAKELAREEASRIVVPSSMPPGMQPGMQPGGAPVAGQAASKIFLKK